MEIILLIAALAATPFGAAMLNKPTRNRVFKYVQVHVVNPAKGIGTGPKTLTEFVRLEPRNKDWGPDGALAVLWEEAFGWYQIRNRDNVLKWAMEKQASYKERIDPVKEKMIGLREQLTEYRSYSRERYYGGFSPYEDFKREIGNLEQTVRIADRAYEESLTKDEKFALKLHAKYGRELYYGNDLIRLAAQKSLPQLDYVALAAYASK